MLTLRTINRILKQITKQCDIDKHLTFHLARHTFIITISQKNGVPLIALNKMLGHKLQPLKSIHKIIESIINSAIGAVNEKIAGKYGVERFLPRFWKISDTQEAARH